jgi:hypothetical protein
MSFLVALGDGFEVLTPTQGPETYEPYVGTSAGLDLQAFWGVVPDDLMELPDEDRKIIETMWGGLIQYAAGFLTASAHLDQSRSLLDFPLHLQRRWLRFEIERAYDLSGAVGLVDRTEGSPGSGITYATKSAPNKISLYGGGAPAQVGVALRSAVRWDATLRWDIQLKLDVDLDSGAEEGWMLLGYANTRQVEATSQSGVWAAISTLGRVGWLCVTSGEGGLKGALVDGQVKFVLGEETFTYLPDETLQISAWYDPGAEGFDTPTAAWATLRVVNTGTGSEANLKTRITPTTTPSTGTPLHQGWYGDLFCIQSPTGDILPWAPGLDTGEFTLQVTPHHLSFLDPSVDGRIRHIPLLQPKVSTDEGFLRYSLEFDLVRDQAKDRWAYLRFEDQPDAVLWADAVALDGALLSKMYTPLTGVASYLGTSDTAKLRTQVIGALYGLLAGPHLGPLSAAVGGLLGVPIAIRDGIVKGFISVGGTPGIVVEEVDRERVYTYPEGGVVLVELGDTVTRLQSLVELPEVHDWVSAPHALANAVSEEMEKFRTVLVRIPSTYIMAEYKDLPRPLTDAIVAAFSRDLSTRLRQYLLNALAVWCSVAGILFQIFYRTVDDLDLTDAFRLSGRKDNDDEGIFPYAQFPRDRTYLTIKDALTNGDQPMYNVDGHLYGDHGEACPPEGLLYNQGELLILPDRVNFTVTYSGADTGTKAIAVYKEIRSLESGESYTFKEPDWWDICVSVPNLDFSKPENSHHLPWQ